MSRKCPSCRAWVVGPLCKCGAGEAPRDPLESLVEHACLEQSFNPANPKLWEEQLSRLPRDPKVRQRVVKAARGLERASERCSVEAVKFLLSVANEDAATLCGSLEAPVLSCARRYRPIDVECSASAEDIRIAIGHEKQLCEAMLETLRLLFAHGLSRSKEASFVWRQSCSYASIRPDEDAELAALEARVQASLDGEQEAEEPLLHRLKGGTSGVFPRPVWLVILSHAPLGALPALRHSCAFLFNLVTPKMITRALCASWPWDVIHNQSPELFFAEQPAYYSRLLGNCDGCPEIRHVLCPMLSLDAASPQMPPKQRHFPLTLSFQNGVALVMHRSHPIQPARLRQLLLTTQLKDMTRTRQGLRVSLRESAADHRVTFAVNQHVFVWDTHKQYAALPAQEHRVLRELKAVGELLFGETDPDLICQLLDYLFSSKFNLHDYKSEFKARFDRLGQIEVRSGDAPATD